MNAVQALLLAIGVRDVSSISALPCSSRSVFRWRYAITIITLVIALGLTWRYLGSYMAAVFEGECSSSDG